MSVGEFIQWKKTSETGNVPEFRFFEPSECTRDVTWKMVMSNNNKPVSAPKNVRKEAPKHLIPDEKKETANEVLAKLAGLQAERHRLNRRGGKS
jgi:hypothetical protein